MTTLKEGDILVGTKDGDALTIQVDHGEFKAIFTCTTESVGVNLTSARTQTLANYMVKRSDVPRMGLLLSGIEAWSTELFREILAQRGEMFASLPDQVQDFNPD